MARPDLTRYQTPVQGPLAFIREQIVLADGRRVGEALAADPWIERDFLHPIFERDPDGLPRYRLVYVELPRGHWKSGGAAAVAAAEAVLGASTDVVIAAADRDQAGIVTENLEGYLGRNQLLRSSFKRRGDEFLVPARGSRVRVIASDAPTAWGLGGTHRRFRVIADELTNWRSEDLWVALSSAGGKVADAQLVVISNAGFDAARSWQWRVRETARLEPWGYLYAPAGTIASWISDAWVAQMRALLPGAAFDRVIRNVWTAESGDFVTRDQWRRCVEPGLRPRTVGSPACAPYFAGLDLGLTKDATALAIVHLDDEEHVVLDALEVWQGSRDEPVDISQIERAIADAARRFPLLEVHADPWQLKGSIARLGAAGVRIREFTFSASTVMRLSSTLYEVISDASLRVFEDEALEREILALQVVQGAGGWRLDHRQGGYSDRAIALALAAQAAIRRRTAGPIELPRLGSSSPAFDALLGRRTPPPPAPAKPDEEAETPEADDDNPRIWRSRAERESIWEREF